MNIHKKWKNVHVMGNVEMDNGKSGCCKNAQTLVELSRERYTTPRLFSSRTIPGGKRPDTLMA